MRSSKRLSVIALVAVAAGLSLTACGPDDSSASGPTSSDTAGATSSSDAGQTLAPSSAPGASDATSAPSTTGGQDGSSGSGSSGTSGSGSGSSGGSSSTGGGSGSSSSGSGSASSGTCKTSDLAISATRGPAGEGLELVDFTNIGQESCTMHGFAGVSLRGSSGQSVDVPRRDPGTTPTVKLAPGQGNGFSLYYALNGSSDKSSGYTYTTMIITPPNETHSKSLKVAIDVPVSDPDQSYVNKNLEIYAVGTTR
ncbi:DUF4232 domain-containing protein [Streptomyces sp. NBC_00669]|uniref:DUF4232 domain-containing protein n=1 Tax=Streptomyces sp. NBC_00669 TaxID=2976011 RepID=UPI002E38023C|nr:DUF4232 domain-containing protein [Streptomyces sp. NBC_00669]